MLPDNPLRPIGSPVTHESWPINWPNFAASPARVGQPARSRRTHALIFSHIQMTTRAGSLVYGCGHGIGYNDTRTCGRPVSQTPRHTRTSKAGIADKPRCIILSLYRLLAQPHRHVRVSSPSCTRYRDHTRMSEWRAVTINQARI